MKLVAKQLYVLCLLMFISSLANAQKWYTDFEEAKSVAQQGDKKIILVFKGSDWNGACVRLKNEIWSQQEFVDYANANYVMLEADFPKRKENKLSKEQIEKNNALMDKYNRARIIPLVVVLNSQGTLLGTTGYKPVSPDKFIELLDFFKG